MHGLNAVGDHLPTIFYAFQPYGVFSVANQPLVGSRNPALALPADAGQHTFALCVALFVRPDHHQKRIHQVHRVVFKPFPAVGFPVAGSDHSDASIYNLRQLGLRLNGFGA